MSTPNSNYPIIELRVAVTTADYFDNGTLRWCICGM